MKDNCRYMNLETTQKMCHFPPVPTRAHRVSLSRPGFTCLTRTWLAKEKFRPVRVQSAARAQINGVGGNRTKVSSFVVSQDFLGESSVTCARHNYNIATGAFFSSRNVALKYLGY